MATFTGSLDFFPLAAVVLKSDASSSSLPIIVPFVDIVVRENSEFFFGNSISFDSAVDVVLQTTTVTILEQAGGRTSGGLTWQRACKYCKVNALVWRMCS